METLIDAHDLVIRINRAPTDDFDSDVGDQDNPSRGVATANSKIGPIRSARPFSS